MNPDFDLLEAGLGLRKSSTVIKDGQLVNVVTGEIYPADVAIYGPRIVAIGDVQEYVGPKTKVVDAHGFNLVPGLIDGHIHFEVTKLSPTMFAKLMLPSGTTSIVTSLDQIYGVGGLKSVRSFLDESKKAHLRMFFGAPCKLPYTIPPSTLHYRFGTKEQAITNRWEESVGVWETLGRFVIGSADGTVGPDREVWRNLAAAYKQRLPAYGSASMLRGKSLSGYICSGIRSDHEAYSPEEFLEKIRNGLYYMIRESSVVHFLEDYVRTIVENKLDTRRIAFCTDDVTASDVLQHGHLDNMVRTSIKLGIEPIKAIQMATMNCAEIYHIDNLVGSISPGRFADILLLDDLQNFRIRKVLVGGESCSLRSSNGGQAHTSKTDRQRDEEHEPEPRFPEGPASQNIAKNPTGQGNFNGSYARDTFVRKRKDVTLEVRNGDVISSPENDVLYVAVVERHRRTGNKAIAFISGYGLKQGAIASSAAPDDNNIVCIGVNQNEMAAAINEVIDMRGGQVVVRDAKRIASIPLPIGGVVADTEPEKMAKLETKLDKAAIDSALNSNLHSCR